MSYELIAPRFYIKTTGTSQSWCYRYTLAGKTTERLLGSVTGTGRVKVTQKQAEARVLQLNAALARGENPFAERARKMQTFGQVFLDHVEIMSERGEWALDHKGEVGTAKQWRRWLETDLAGLARLGFNHPDMEFAAREALRSTWGTKKGDDMLNAVARTFRRAKLLKLWSDDVPVSREIMTGLYGSGRDNRAVEDGGDVKHHAMLDYAGVPAVLATLAGGKGKGMATFATRFLILTTARTGNVIMCRKADIDRAARTWTIAVGDEWGTRMKNGAEHTYYLNDQAMEIVNALWELPGEYLFSGKEGKPLNKGALNDKITDPKAKGGLGLKGQATAHGFRASFGTWAKNETRMGDVADAMLAHAEGKVRAAYQRGDAVKQMVELSRLWGNHCAGIEIDNVTPLRKAA